MPTSLSTTMRQTTDAFIHAWEAWKVDPIMAVRAPECIISQFPTSLQIPDRDNDDFRKWFGGVEGLLSNCKMTAHDYFASEEERRAWVHCSMTADRKGSEGRYEMEYMFVLSFDSKGEKIERIVEMMDSHRVREAWGKASEVEFKRE